MSKKWNEVLEAKQNLDSMVEKLDLSMNRVVKWIELDYLDGYNRFVNKKE